jgi:hypothetical protein
MAAEDMMSRTGRGGEGASDRRISPEQLLDHVIAILHMHCPPIAVNSWQPLGPPLFTRLRELGRTRRCKVWHSQTTGEYLWDITWTVEQDASYWVELAGEIELSDMIRRDVEDDFYKVLDAKAHVKLFVAATSRKMAQELREEIDWAITHQRFRLPEERLVAVLVTYDGRRKTYSATTRIFDGRGPIEAYRGDWETILLGTAQ